MTIKAALCVICSEKLIAISQIMKSMGTNQFNWFGLKKYSTLLYTAKKYMQTVLVAVSVTI